MSADGSVRSLGRRITSSSVKIVSSSYLMKLPVIFFASAYGVTIPLPKTNVLSYVENIFVHRSSLTMHRDMRKKDNSFVLREGITNIPDTEINKKDNFMVSVGKCIAIPYERTASLPRTLFKSYDEITSVYRKTATAYFFVPLYMYMWIPARNRSALCRNKVDMSGELLTMSRDFAIRYKDCILTLFKTNNYRNLLIMSRYIDIQHIADGVMYMYKMGGFELIFVKKTLTYIITPGYFS